MLLKLQTQSHRASSPSKGTFLSANGNGDSIRIGINPWVPRSPSSTPRLNPRYQLLVTQLVSSFLYKHKSGWNIHKIQQLFYPFDATAILASHPPSRNGLPDTLLWTPSKTRKFSLKSTCRKIKNPHASLPLHNNKEQSFWNWWWKLPCHPMLLLFGRRIFIIASLPPTTSTVDTSQPMDFALSARILSLACSSFSTAHYLDVFFTNLLGSRLTT